MPAFFNVQLLVLEGREPAANMARFYVLAIEETLSGETTLVREWGRLGTSGRPRLDAFQEQVQATEALESWFRRKLRKGYHARVLQTPAPDRSEMFDAAAVTDRS